MVSSICTNKHTDTALLSLSVLKGWQNLGLKSVNLTKLYTFPRKFLKTGCTLRDLGFQHEEIESITGPHHFTVQASERSESFFLLILLLSQRVTITLEAHTSWNRMLNSLGFSQATWHGNYTNPWTQEVKSPFWMEAPGRARVVLGLFPEPNKGNTF